MNLHLENLRATAPTMVEIVVAAMESVPAGFSVPLRVEIKMRRTWAECK